jgi:hypothetical protein
MSALTIEFIIVDVDTTCNLNLLNSSVDLLQLVKRIEKKTLQAFCRVVVILDPLVRITTSKASCKTQCRA